MSYKIVNEELRIQSCSIEDLSPEVKDLFVKQFKGDRVETLTLFYEPTTDAVVINHDNNDYELYELIANTYLTVDTSRRKVLRKQAEEILGKGYEETLDLLDAVIRCREKLKYDKEAMELRKILGNQAIEPYLSDLNILTALRIVDEQHNDGFFNDYNPFMYGYIQGIRAERARRKSSHHGC